MEQCHGPSIRYFVHDMNMEDVRWCFLTRSEVIECSKIKPSAHFQKSALDFIFEHSIVTSLLVRKHHLTMFISLSWKHNGRTMALLRGRLSPAVLTTLVFCRRPKLAS